MLVAHELEAAQAFADRLAVLDRGVILQTGRPPRWSAAPAARRVAELVGYRASCRCRAEPGPVAGIHPERVVPGRQPGRGLVLAGTVTRCGRPAAGLGGRSDGRSGGQCLPAVPSGRASAGGGRCALTAPTRPGVGPDGAAVPARAGTSRSRCWPRRASADGTRSPAPRRCRRDRDGCRARPGRREAAVLRQARGYSQQQLAGMAGVSRQAVSAVEAGHSDPSLRVALALARALGSDRGATVRAGDAAAGGAGPAGGAARRRGARVTLAPVGDSFVALPLAGGSPRPGPGSCPRAGRVAGRMPSGPGPAARPERRGPGRAGAADRAAPADPGGGGL